MGFLNTTKERELFDRLLDKNWELSQYRKKVKPSSAEYFALAKEVADLEKELRQAMGDEEYEAFMFMGAKMFS